MEYTKNTVHMHAIQDRVGFVILDSPKTSGSLNIALALIDVISGISVTLFLLEDAVWAAFEGQDEARLVERTVDAGIEVVVATEDMEARGIQSEKVVSKVKHFSYSEIINSWAACSKLVSI